MRIADNWIDSWLRGPNIIVVHFKNASYVYDPDRRMLKIVKLGGKLVVRDSKFGGTDHYDITVDGHEAGVIEKTANGVMEIYSSETWEAAKKSPIEKWDLTAYPNR